MSDIKNAISERIDIFHMCTKNSFVPLNFYMKSLVPKH